MIDVAGTALSPSTPGGEPNSPSKLPEITSQLSPMPSKTVRRRRSLKRGPTEVVRVYMRLHTTCAGYGTVVVKIYVEFLAGGASRPSKSIVRTLPYRAKATCPWPAPEEDYGAVEGKYPDTICAVLRSCPSFANRFGLLPMPRLSRWGQRGAPRTMTATTGPR